MATLASGFVLNSLPYLIVRSPFIEVDQPGFDMLGTGAWHGVPYTGLHPNRIPGRVRNHPGEDSIWASSLRGRRQRGNLSLLRHSSRSCSRPAPIFSRAFASAVRHHWRRRSSVIQRPIRIRCWYLTSSSPLSSAARRSPAASDQCGRRLSGWPLSRCCRTGSIVRYQYLLPIYHQRLSSSSARSSLDVWMRWLPGERLWQAYILDEVQDVRLPKIGHARACEPIMRQ